MSFEDYVRHVKLKYRLATALSVIKTKPEHLTMEEYITTLRNKLKTVDQMDVDSDCSLQSNDFALYEDSIPETVENGNIQPLTRETVESPTILIDFDPDIVLRSINGENGEHRKCSVDEALILIDNLDADGFATASESKYAASPSYQRTTHTEDIITNNTEMTLSQNTTQVTEKTKALKENITKFVNSIGTMNEKATPVATQPINKEIPASAAKNNEKQALKLTDDRVQTQVTDTQETELYSPSDYTQNTHISQSQRYDTNRFNKLDKYIKNNNDNSKNPNISKEITPAKASLKENNQNGDTQLDSDSIDLEIGKIVTAKATDVGNNAIAGEIKERNVQQDKLEQVTNRNRHLGGECQRKKEPKTNADEEIGTGNEENFREMEENTQMQLDNDSEGDIFDSQSEMTVPFKIIEELNKIKTILNRRNERRISTDSFSTESGYRSDSQKKSTKTGLQSSRTWLNQSAHALFAYLIQCPLTPSTSEITREISQVLGDLIDKLHSDEKYPSFLDQLLETIDNLLEEISGRVDDWESVITKKDESIHRILLLNTSIHMITSTIEKMTTILENLHKNITKEGDNMCEMTNIEATENSVYIFHTLERLLHRYLRRKQDLSSQCTSQLTDDEKIPKRSSLAEFWRQKWDPDAKIKDGVKNLDADVKCVDIKVGEVLNKLVIDCMAGYSLVAFSALECFNVLQS